MIKLGDVVMILDLHRQGLSVSAIGRELGIDRKTVRKYIARGLEPPVYGPRQARSRLIDPYVAYLRERVTAYPGLSGRRLLREIRERGYQGGYTARSPRPSAICGRRRRRAMRYGLRRRQAIRRRSTSPTSRPSSATSPGWSARCGCSP